MRKFHVNLYPFNAQSLRPLLQTLYTVVSNLCCYSSGIKCIYGTDVSKMHNNRANLFFIETGK